MALTHAERPMLHAAVVAVREVAVERSIAHRGNGPLCLGGTMRACMNVARKSHISMPAGMAWRFKAMKTADIPQTLRLLLSLAVGTRAFIGGHWPELACMEYAPMGRSGIFCTRQLGVSHPPGDGGPDPAQAPGLGLIPPCQSALWWE